MYVNAANIAGALAQLKKEGKMRNPAKALWEKIEPGSAEGKAHG